MRADGSNPSRWNRRIDRLGLLAAIGCGIHCAAFSIVLLLYPALWLNRGLRESGLWTVLWWTEYTMLGLAWLLAVTAAVVAWVRCGSRLPAVLVALGLALLTIAIATPLHGTSPTISLIAVAGGLLVAGAHWLNLRRRPGRV